MTVSAQRLKVSGAPRSWEESNGFSSPSRRPVYMMETVSPGSGRSQPTPGESVVLTTPPSRAGVTSVDMAVGMVWGLAGMEWGRGGRGTAETTKPDEDELSIGRRLLSYSSAHV